MAGQSFQNDQTLGQFFEPLYYSAMFLPAERNYDIYERELLAMMKALAHWRHYLEWTKYPFIILTDHANLQY